MRLLTKMMNKEEVEEKRLSCLMESKKRIYKIIKDNHSEVVCLPFNSALQGAISKTASHV